MDIESESDDWNPDPNSNMLDKHVIHFSSNSNIQIKISKKI